MLTPVRQFDLTIHGIPDSIETALIANDSITTPKIQDESVTQSKISPSAIINDKVSENAAISQSKIASSDNQGDLSKTLVTDLQSRVKRDSDEEIVGSWSFTNPVTVPDAILHNQAVNLSQLKDLNIEISSDTGSSYTNLKDTLSEIYGNLGGGGNELDVTQSSAGLEQDGTYLTNLSANYINTATTLKEADNLLDGAIKDVSNRVSTLEVKTIHSGFIDIAAGGETTLYRPNGSPLIPDSELTELYIDGRKVRRSSGSPLVERVFKVSEDGSHVVFSALSQGQDVELRYWA